MRADSQHRRLFIFAVLIAVGVVVAVISFRIEDLTAKQDSSGILLPFVWPDVAIVCLLSTVPLAWMIGQFAIRRMNVVACCLAAAMLWAVVWWAFVRVEDFEGASQSLPAFSATNRLLASLGITTGIALFSQSLTIPSIDHRNKNFSEQLLSFFCGLTVMILLPETYVDARSQHDAQEFFSLRAQSRFGEARTLLCRMLILDPLVQFDGRLLKRERHDLERTVETLQQHVQQPLSATADFSQCLERARELAMLGRTFEALRLLPANNHTLRNADACLCLGTIYENQTDWNSAIRFYETAHAILKDAPETADSRAQSYQVSMGLAYCFRRQGKLSEARNAYLSLLTIAPDADTHFLLAQFFEDIQETIAARHHAQIAIQMAPTRYGGKGNELIRKMQALHFGCFGIYRDPAPNE